MFQFGHVVWEAAHSFVLKQDLENELLFGVVQKLSPFNIFKVLLVCSVLEGLVGRRNDSLNPKCLPLA